jgi:hypothetical protein
MHPAHEDDMGVRQMHDPDRSTASRAPEAGADRPIGSFLHVPVKIMHRVTESDVTSPPTKRDVARSCG